MSGVLILRFGRRSAPLLAIVVLAASVAVSQPAEAAATTSTTSASTTTTTTTEPAMAPIVRDDNYVAVAGVPFNFDGFLDNDELFGLPIIEGSSQGLCNPEDIDDIVVIDFSTGIVSGTVANAGTCTFAYGLETAAGLADPLGIITIVVNAP